MKDPGRVIPRSILISTLAVAAIYFGINLSIVGVVPWREFVPADAHPESRLHRVPVHGAALRPARRDACSPLLVLWTAFGSVFALLLGYSRIPYAAARRAATSFARSASCIRRSGFPHVSLLVLGAISILAGFFRSAR